MEMTPLEKSPLEKSPLEKSPLEKSPLEKSPPVVWVPQPLAVDSCQWIPAEYTRDRTLRKHLLALGLDPHREIVVYHNNRLVTVEEWDTLTPVPGDYLVVEGTLSGGGGSNPIAAILMIVLMVFAPYLAPALAGAMGVTSAAGILAVQGAIMMVGGMIINSLFPPKVATLKSTQESPTYSLSGGSNRLRPYEPLPLLLGNHRIFPDYGAKPYTEFEGEDQYLYQVFNFGIGDLVINDIRIGETLLSNYTDWTVTRAENGDLPGFWGNVDTTEGASLLHEAGWITRTTGLATVRIAVDLTGMFSYIGSSGKVQNRSADFSIEYCVTGTEDWQPFIPGDPTQGDYYWSFGYWEETITDPYYDQDGNYYPGDTAATTWRQLDYDTNPSPTAHTDGAIYYTPYMNCWRWGPAGTDPHPATSYDHSYSLFTLQGASTKPQRRTFSRDVPSGQYDVRLQRISPDETSTKATSSTEWLAMRSYQEGIADYSNQTVLGVKIKATAQLNGMIEQLSALGTRSTQVWNGSEWMLRTTTNPAWWFLELARGFRDATGHLLYGGGLSDERIDIEGIQAWAEFCDANALSFSAVFDQQQTLADSLNVIARCGFGSCSWASGKLGVVWDAPNQTPVMAYGMANIAKGSFEVAYVTSALADEIVVNYTNRNNKWESDQIRVTVPGANSTPVRPTTVDYMGCTTNAHAGKYANALAAQQYYRRRTITWETDFEGMVCQRGDVVILSHDLTQWGYSGRFVAVDGNKVVLSRTVPRTGLVEYLMIEYPDGTLVTTQVLIDENIVIPDLHFFSSEFATTFVQGAVQWEESDTLTLAIDFVLQEGYGPVDHKWFFSPLPTPGKKVKITAVTPLEVSRVRLTATDEYPEYYAAWDGVFTQPPRQSLLTPGNVYITHLTLNLNAVVVDIFQINRVTASWRQYGAIESCTVSAWLDGIPYQTWTGIRDAALVIDLSEQEGTVIVEVTPISASGPGAPVRASISLSALPAPEAPTLTVTGGLFCVIATWTFGGEREDMAYTEIWTASTNNRENALRLTAQPYPAMSFQHNGLPPGMGGFYWARVVDTRGNVSEWFPESATGGLYAEAITDPASLLDMLHKALGEDELAAGLASRIDMIDGPDSVFGTVANLIATLQKQIDEMNQMPAYAPSMVYQEGDVVLYNGGIYRADQTTQGNLPTDPNFWTKIGDYRSLGEAVALLTQQFTLLTEDNSALVQSLTQLAARVEGVNTDTLAAIQAEATARADADGALATQVNTVLTQANNNTTAAVQAEATARSNADGALATSINSSLAQANSYAYGIVQSEATARANADSVTAQNITNVQTTLNTNIAAVQTYATAVNTALGNVQARWGVKTQTVANGVPAVAGIELLSGANGQSTFAILADKFLIYQPDGYGTPKQIFSMGTVNGVNALGFSGSAIFDGTVTANKVDTRGLSIKDAAGNVILASGTNLDISYIKNLPITSTNISTWISNLAVGSLQIAGNAVTVPSFYSANDYVGGTGVGNLINIGELWVNLDQPGFVMAIMSSSQWHGPTAPITPNFHFYLYINGDEVASAGGTPAAQVVSVSLAGARYLSAGSHVVRMYYEGSRSDIYAGLRTLIVMGVKK